MTDPRVMALFRALAPGQRLWLRAEGNSLWPLMRGGDLLEIERCEPTTLELGDIAVIQLGPTLIAHITVHLAPVRTASIVGVLDASGEVLGRVTALRRGERRVPWPRALNRVMRYLPSTSTRVKRLPGLRQLIRWVRDSSD